MGICPILILQGCKINADFIYKKREYFGPVDIYRFSIKLLNITGSVINLHGAEYSFAIEVNTKYDLLGTE